MNLFTLHHVHEHGTDCYLFRTKLEPLAFEPEAVAQFLKVPYEKDRGEKLLVIWNPGKVEIPIFGPPAAGAAFMVSWVQTYNDGSGTHHYTIYCEEFEGKTPEQQAREEYQSLLEQDNIYTVQLSQIVASTEPQHIPG